MKKTNLKLESLHTFQINQPLKATFFKTFGGVASTSSDSSTSNDYSDHNDISEYTDSSQYSDDCTAGDDSQYQD